MKENLSNRQIKISSLICQTMNNLFIRNNYYFDFLQAGHNLISVTITDIHVSRDIRNCKAFLSFISSDLNSNSFEQFVEQYQQISYIIFKDIAKEIYLKYMPKISFVEDKIGRNASKINELLLSVKDDIDNNDDEENIE